MCGWARASLDSINWKREGRSSKLIRRFVVSHLFLMELYRIQLKHNPLLPFKTLVPNHSNTTNLKGGLPVVCTTTKKCNTSICHVVFHWSFERCRGQLLSQRSELRLERHLSLHNFVARKDRKCMFNFLSSPKDWDHCELEGANCKHIDIDVYTHAKCGWTPAYKQVSACFCNHDMVLVARPCSAGVGGSLSTFVGRNPWDLTNVAHQSQSKLVRWCRANGHFTMVCFVRWMIYKYLQHDFWRFIMTLLESLSEVRHDQEFRRGRMLNTTLPTSCVQYINAVIDDARACKAWNETPSKNAGITLTWSWSSTCINDLPFSIHHMVETSKQRRRVCWKCCVLRTFSPLLNRRGIIAHSKRWMLLVSWHSIGDRLALICRYLQFTMSASCSVWGLLCFETFWNSVSTSTVVQPPDCVPYTVEERSQLSWGRHLHSGLQIHLPSRRFSIFWTCQFHISYWSIRTTIPTMLRFLGIIRLGQVQHGSHAIVNFTHLRLSKQKLVKSTRSSTSEFVSTLPEWVLKGTSWALCVVFIASFWLLRPGSSQPQSSTSTSSKKFFWRKEKWNPKYHLMQHLVQLPVYFPPWSKTSKKHPKSIQKLSKMYPKA